MEKPVIRISVRNLVEFILRNGDLESGGTAGDKEAMLKGSRLHRKIQKQMGSHYQPEVSLKKDTEYDDLILRVEGRADESARKKGVHQFFFVNGRYMKHPYFNKWIHQPGMVARLL